MKNCQGWGVTQSGNRLLLSCIGLICQRIIRNIIKKTATTYGRVEESRKVVKISMKTLDSGLDSTGRFNNQDILEYAGPTNLGVTTPSAACRCRSWRSLGEFCWKNKLGQSPIGFECADNCLHSQPIENWIHERTLPFELIFPCIESSLWSLICELQCVGRLELVLLSWNILETYWMQSKRDSSTNRSGPKVWPFKSSYLCWWLAFHWVRTKL